MYLEGSDQHRGWFQSGLLTSVGAYDQAPFESVLTHGFIVDGEGRKMSKSLGNVISPLDVIERSGADIIRLWVASGDYSQDVSVSDEILERTSEAYRRFRNTFRFLLGNLYDYDPRAAVEWADMPELDRVALAQLAGLLDRVTEAYDAWRFHLVYRAVYEYAVGDLSAVYLDVLKDRLYSDAADSTSRRSAQTVLAQILGVLVRVLAPVLSFTCEEVWQHMPASLRDADSVHLSLWPIVDIPQDTSTLLDEYADILAVREVVTKALEGARADETIGKSQEALVIVGAPPSVHSTLAARPAADLAELFIVSAVHLEEADEIAVSVRPAPGDKCPRCWNVRQLGVDTGYPELCDRCASVLRLLEQPSHGGADTS
jgi:isoleucyl-tRNA synthetase